MERTQNFERLNNFSNVALHPPGRGRARIWTQVCTAPKSSPSAHSASHILRASESAEHNSACYVDNLECDGKENATVMAWAI